MLQSVYATKIGMTQAWTATGKRLPVTRCQAAPMSVVSVREVLVKDKDSRSIEKKQTKQVQLGLGTKKIEKMAKPLRSYLTTQGFSHGVRQIKTSYLTDQSTELTPGTTLALSDILTIGDVVHVQGISKGHGYTGVVKRHGFAGGPKTHGQSDRHRAPGSIGQRTTPGRVHKNKRMAGHDGVTAITVLNLTVVHLDPATGEIWLSGPVPGSVTSQLRITKTGQSKQLDLNRAASNLPVVAEPSEPDQTEVEAVADQAPTAQTSEETNSESAPVKSESDTTENSTNTKENAVA